VSLRFDSKPSTEFSCFSDTIAGMLKSTLLDFVFLEPTSYFFSFFSISSPELEDDFS
jgi:hypothetical protein